MPASLKGKGRHIPLAFAALVIPPVFGQSEPPGLTVRSAGVVADGGDLQADRPIVLEMDVVGASTDSPGPRLWIEESFAGTTAAGAQTCEARAERLSGAVSLSPPVRDFNSMAVALVTPTGLHILDPRGGLRGARSLAFADFGGTASSWTWGARSGMFHAVLPERREVITVDPGVWRVTERLQMKGVPVAVLEDGKGDLAVLSRLGDIDEVDWPRRGTGRPVTLPPGNTRLIPMEVGRVGAVSPGRFVIIDGQEVRSIRTGLDAQTYPVSARTIFGFDRDGVLRFHEPLTGENGPVAGMEGITSSRLWTTPDDRIVIAWRTEGKEFHVIDVARRAKAHSIPWERPQSFAASSSFLFIRSGAQGELLVVPREGLLEGSPAAPRRIAAGELPGMGRALPIAASDDGTATWIDPERAQVYVYHEGMNIPSATLRMPTPDVLDIALIGPLVRPNGPGRYTATATIDEPGEYVAVTMVGGATPPTCRTFVLGGKARAGRPAERFAVTTIDPPTTLIVGRTTSFRFLVAAADGGVLPEIPSMGVLVMEVGGTYQERWRALRQSDGSLRADLTPRRAGKFILMPDSATVPGRVVGRPITAIEVEAAE